MRAATYPWTGTRRRTAHAAHAVLAGLETVWAGVLLLAFLAGLPYGLLAIYRHAPVTWDPRVLLGQPPTLALLLTAATGLGWALWAWLLSAIVRDLIDAVRAIPRRTRRLPVPLHTAVTGTAAALALLATHIAQTVTGTATATEPGPTRPHHAAPTTTAQPAPHAQWPRGGVVLLAATSTTPAPADATQHRPAGPTYRVARGDRLAGIADRYLADPTRYPDIAALNPHLEARDHRFPDHIEPGWQVHLPTDAHDHGRRRHASGQLDTLIPAAPAQPDGAPGDGPPHPPDPPPPPSTPPTPPDRPSPLSSVAVSADPHGVATVPGGGAPPHPSGGSANPRSTASTGNPGERPSDRGTTGVDLPGGWVGIPLAAALAAAGAMLWRRRQHRYTPHPVNQPAPDEDRVRPLPPVIGTLRRTVRVQAPDLLTPPAPPPTVAEYAATGRPVTLPPVGPGGPELAGLTEHLPSRGLGLSGPGAHAAGRALLVATLSTGSPDDPDAKGTVITTADTLRRLLGEHTERVGPIPRLHVADDLPDAVTQLEELLIERRRLLDEHHVLDLPGLRDTSPYHPPMPPVLLLCQPPPPPHRARLSSTLQLAAPVQISAVLLGDWPDGTTCTVTTTGHTTAGDGDPARLAVLDAPTTIQLLGVLREAHTGEPTPATVLHNPTLDAPATPGPQHHDPGPPQRPDPPPPAAQPQPPPGTATNTNTATATNTNTNTNTGTGTGTGTDQLEPTAAEPAAPSPDHPEPNTTTPAATDTTLAAAIRRTRKVPIRLLGAPAILDRDGTPIPGLRHHARQLLVYLAVHRSGADLPDIMEAFWPTATLRRAGERLSTEVADLRGRIRDAAAHPKIQPVVNTGGRYHLNPDLLDIDLWRLTDALHHATTATDPAQRVAALHQVVDADTGVLAAGHDYDWIEAPREQLRRHGIRARLQLAELLTDTDPARAAEHTRAAADRDPYNEDLARRAMRAHARLGDTAAIHARLQRLREALDAIDAEPGPDTLALAAQLLRHTHPAPRQPDGDTQPAEPTVERDDSSGTAPNDTAPNDTNPGGADPGDTAPGGADTDPTGR